MITSGYFPARNGYINLRNGELIRSYSCDHNSFFLTKWKGLNYDTSKIEQYINDLMLGDKKKIHTLQRTLGCLITGDCPSKIFNFCGSGSNGKTTLFRFFHKLLGTLAIHINNIEDLTPNIRVVYTDDVNLIEPILIESITIRRNLRRNPTTFESQTQFIIDSNDKLYISNVVETLQFPTKFVQNVNESIPTQRQCVPTIMHDLDGIMDQLLVWVVKGSIMYYMGGTPPHLSDSKMEGNTGET